MATMMQPVYGCLAREERDIESENERKTQEVCDKVILKLFNSNTEESDFTSFSAQEEDEDSNQ